MSYFSLQYGWHVRDVKFPFNSEYNDVRACWRIHQKRNLHLPEPNTAGLNNQTWQIGKTPLDLTKRYPNAGWYEGIVSLEFSEVFESLLMLKSWRCTRRNKKMAFEQTSEKTSNRSPSCKLTMIVGRFWATHSSLRLLPLDRQKLEQALRGAYSSIYGIWYSPLVNQFSIISWSCYFY